MAKSRTVARVEDVVIGTVERQKREQIRVSVRKQGGVKWLDIRIYYEAETGDMRPSQRGVSLSSDEWKKLREVLQRLHQKDGRADVGASTQP
jgi:hypothetical protein